MSALTKVILVAVFILLSDSARGETVCNRNLTFDFDGLQPPPDGVRIEGETSAEGEIQRARCHARFRAEGNFDTYNLVIEFRIPVTIDGVRAIRTFRVGYFTQGILLSTNDLDGSLELFDGAPYQWSVDIINRDPAAGPIQGVFERLEFVFEMSSCVTGDVNCDGAVTSGDVDAFVVALAGVDEYVAAYPDCLRTLADINYDGVVDPGDLDAFMCCVAAGGCATCTRGNVVLYDGTALPERAGWTRDDRLFQPDRWLDSGWFYQYCEVVPDGPGLSSEDDFSHQEFDEMEFAPHWFLEWRMMTDGPPNFAAGVPAMIAVSCSALPWYHFTIGRDRIRFMPGHVTLPFVFADITPGVPHTYRLELHPGSYEVRIDGELIAMGAAIAPCPNQNPSISFGSRAPLESSTTGWDFIRFGSLAPSIPGDCNCDGVVDFFDIDPFLLALFRPADFQAAHPACSIHAADADGDARVDFFDIDPFVACLVNGGCP